MRKIRKNNMKQFKPIVIVVAAVSFFITFIIYYRSHSTVPADRNNFILIEKSEEVKEIAAKPIQYRGTAMKHMPLDEIYKNPDDNTASYEDFKMAPMINNHGCRIPISMIPYRSLKRMKPGNCGKRAVFLTKLDSNKVKAMIHERTIRSYLKKSALYKCCFRFIRRQTNRKIQYTRCQKFLNGEIITLKSDFVNIQCSEQKKNKSHVVYDDVYAFAKTLNITNNHSNHTCKHKYNVLLLGMDSMSLPRFSLLMNRTAYFFKDNSWLAFRGFHKVGDNTLPNLLPVFTGHNMSFMTEKCSRKMENCSDFFIWNKFKNLGYVTAYGEDYLKLPDTFHDEFEFKNPPTDHYMRPLFMKGETEHTNVICSGKVSSGQQVLDYALDFALTYRSESFFGLFWINSYSHNKNSQPQDADKMFENFFNRLSYTGVLDNTFIIFFSDHGIRFGEQRFLVQSYYDERMPFLFVWTPFLFKRYQLPLFNSLASNQFKLLTPFDLHHTLLDIYSISACELDKRNYYKKNSRVLESCPKCHSMFKVVSNQRTCKDAAIHEKWCSCHNLYPLDVEDTEGLKSVDTIVTHIKMISKTVKTLPCWSCMALKLKNVIRIHFYYDNEKVNLYHVVALSMSPGNISYEGTVLRKSEKAKLVGRLSVISFNKSLGKCAQKNSKGGLFCVCQKIENCTMKS